MRLTPDGPWRRFQARQWFLGSAAAFRWRARLRVAPLLTATVLDSFEGGNGALRVSLLGVIPIVRCRGEAFDRGEAARGLAELPWRPWAFREAAPLTWQMTSNGMLRCAFDDGRTRASVEFAVANDGRVLSASACRPRAVGKSAVDTPWCGVFQEYRLLDGTNVPTRAEASWHLPDGKFTYWRGRVTEFHALT
jgi:Family of unknown function (DUF6920)